MVGPTMVRCSALLIILSLKAWEVDGFARRASISTVLRAPSAFSPPDGTWTRTRTARFTFLKDLFDKAFENDSNLSQDDKLKGMLEGPGEELNAPPQRQRTATQEKWQQLFQQQQQQEQRPTMEETRHIIDLFLSGVPNKDPSNDLFGSKVNISSRDRKTGLAVPETPTVTDIEIVFSSNGNCRITSSSPFVVSDSEGEWKLSDDGKQIRFRIQVTGYTRTIETKGTIQKIYWTDEDNKVRQTSTVYTIPAGWLYGEAVLSRSQRGLRIEWSDGILKVEQTRGLLGAASRMIPCGKFTARQVDV